MKSSPFPLFLNILGAIASGLSRFLLGFLLSMSLRLFMAF